MPHKVEEVARPLLAQRLEDELDEDLWPPQKPKPSGASRSAWGLWKVWAPLRTVTTDRAFHMSG